MVVRTNSLDSLALLEEVMRHFYIKAMIEQSFGEHTDWKEFDRAMRSVSDIGFGTDRRRHCLTH